MTAGGTRSRSAAAVSSTAAPTQPATPTASAASCLAGGNSFPAPGVMPMMVIPGRPNRRAARSVASTTASRAGHRPDMPAGSAAATAGPAARMAGPGENGIMPAA